MLGENIKKIREERNLGLNETARRANISAAYLSGIENGKKTNVGMAIVERIAEVLGVPAGNLLEQHTKSEVTYNVDNHKFDLEIKEELLKYDIFPVGELKKVPIVGEIKAGFDALALQNPMGYEVIDRDMINGDDCFYLCVKGDSMYPTFMDNDLVLIRPASDVDSGDIAAVLVNGDEGTLKRVIKKDDSIILQPLNPSYPARIFTGKELNDIKIVGKALRSLRRF